MLDLRFFSLNFHDERSTEDSLDRRIRTLFLYVLVTCREDVEYKNALIIYIRDYVH